MKIKSLLAVGTLAICATNTFALTTSDFVSEQSAPGSFSVFANGEAASIFTDANDWAGVQRAAGDLQADIHRVSGLTSKISTDETNFRNQRHSDWHRRQKRNH